MSTVLKIFLGFQLCGPENIAIIKIRFITFSLSLIWPVVLLASGATPTFLSYLHGIEGKSHIDYIKSNRVSLLNLVFPASALIINAAMKIYSDQLNRQMATSDSVFVIYGVNTQSAHKQEEKFSFSLGSMVGFPAIILLTFFISFGSRNLRLLLFIPIQVSMVAIALPSFIIYMNRKIKQRAFNLASDISETFETSCVSLKKLRSIRIAPKMVAFRSGPNQNF